MFPYRIFREGRRNVLAILCFSLAAVLVAVVLTAVGSIHPSSAFAQSCRAWTVVQSPSIPTKINVLTSVSASASNDIWAVGYSADYGNEPDNARTLIMHWDGNAWAIVPSPNPSDTSNYLDGVAAISPGNAWAVGDSGSSANPRSILLHWDGTAWTPGKLPPLGDDGSSLYALKAVSANDIWAVGEAGNSQFSNGMVLHYDGNDWLISLNIAFGLPSIFYGVNARNASEVWAVGAKVTEQGVQDLRMRWNGTKWEQIEEDRTGNPTLRAGLDIAFSPDSADLWIAGNATGSGTQAGILHYNGTNWERGNGDFHTRDMNSLSGILATSKTDIWAVGSARTGTESIPFITHSSNGTDWVPESGAAITGSGALSDITALPNGDYIAVGIANGGTLIEVYSDQCAPAQPTETSAPVSPPTSATTSIPTAIPTYPATPIPGDNNRTFTETGKTIKGIFLNYWTNNGGLAQQGYPISEMFGEVSPLDGKVYTVQYFERAVFEYHPENQPPYNVLLSQLGTFRYAENYKLTPPAQSPNTSSGSQLFAETGKRLGGKFLDYWQQHGGLAQQGYPITDEFQEKSDLDGKTYTVQYFERAVFELHPEFAGTEYEVLLSQLGTFRLHPPDRLTP